MCGILGMIGNVPENLQLEAHQLLTNIFRVSIVRGKDASGFAAIHNEKNASLITDKRPISSPKFVKRCAKFKALRRAMPAIFIGHTRLSTAGSPKRGRNNHPFNNETYSMVHNGTIKDWKDVVKKNGISMRSETDSEIILRILERYEDPLEGFQTVVDTLPKESTIAVALLKHNSDAGISLSLFRNDGRPLVVMAAPYFRSIIFASTKEIIEMALKYTYRGSVDAKIKDYGLNISEFPEYRYMEFALNDMGNPYTARKEEVKKPIAGFLPAPKQGASSRPGPGVFGRDEKKKDSGSSTRRLPISAESVETAKEVAALHKAAEESGKILRAIRDNPYITKGEIEHWKKWRLQV